MSFSFVTTLAAVVAVSMLVVVHEFGHYIVAKLLGVRVLVFSLFFGKRLFGVKIGATDYRVSSLPFGGYVRMAHADPFGDQGYFDDDDDDTPRSERFSLRPAWQRLLIMFGGPFANLVFPFGLFTLLFWAGEPQPESVVGTVASGSPAAAAGMVERDRVVSVNGEPVRTWYDVDDILSVSTGDVRLGIERDAGAVELIIPRPANVGERFGPGDLGLDSLAPDLEIGVDDSASPAGAAGLRTGDRVLAVDGVEVRDFNELELRLATAGPTATLSVVTGRQEPRDVTLTRADPAAKAWTDADGPATRLWGIASATWFVKGFTEESAAKKAGVQVGDRLLVADGTPVRRFTDVIRAVNASATGGGSEQTARPVDLVVRRDGQLVAFTIQPDVVRMSTAGLYVWRPLIGIDGDGGFVDAREVRRPYPLTEAFPRAVDTTLGIVTAIIRRLGEMATLEAPVLDNLGGPVAMVSQAKEAVALGPFALGRMIAFFSISLFVLNLLPIPVLDGGTIFMYAAEWLRGRPLPRVLQERAQQFGVVFLVLLTLVVLANDSVRLVTSWFTPS